MTSRVLPLPSILPELALDGGQTGDRAERDT
jgi:hypothetical protein